MTNHHRLVIQNRLSTHEIPPDRFIHTVEEQQSAARPEQHANRATDCSPRNESAHPEEPQEQRHFEGRMHPEYPERTGLQELRSIEEGPQSEYGQRETAEF